jgi:hypothetical protein
MLKFLQYTLNSLNEERAVQPANEEHVLAHAWNHLVGKGVVRHGDDNTQRINKEVEKAQTDKDHPLHISNTPATMFRGGKKNKASYHAELKNAANTINTWSKHKKLKKAIEGKHQARVLGTEKGEVSETWQKHGATGSATRTSKSDLAIYDPKGKESAGINVSLKKAGGSQLVAAQSKENLALHHHAATTMIEQHYGDKSEKEKKKIHAGIMAHATTLSNMMKEQKGKPKAEQDEIVKRGNGMIKEFHARYPHLNYHLRKEAATGMGKFNRSHHAAHFFGKIASGKGGASISHHTDREMDDIYSGPLPRMSIGAHPRINSKGKPVTQREGRLRLDVRK